MDFATVDIGLGQKEKSEKGRTVTRNVTSRDVTGRNTPVTVTQEEGNVDADGKADGEGQSYGLFPGCSSPLHVGKRVTRMTRMTR